MTGGGWEGGKKEVNGERKGRNRGERKHISGGEGICGPRKSRGEGPFSPRCSPLPKGDSPVTQEERGITRRLEEGGERKGGRKEEGERKGGREAGR